MIEDIGYHQFGTEVYHPFRGLKLNFRVGLQGEKLHRQMFRTLM